MACMMVDSMATGLAQHRFCDVSNHTPYTAADAWLGYHASPPLECHTSLENCIT